MRKEIGIWAVFTAIALYFAWLKQPTQVDDALIYLRYVRNIVEGNGWVFNDGEWVNGATSTGNTLLLTLFSFLTGGRYVLAGILVFGLGVGAAAYFAFALMRRTGVVPATLAAAIVMCTPYLYWLVGMDASSNLGLALAAVWAYDRGRLKLAALLLSALFLTRPDGVFLLAVLLGHHLYRNRADLSAASARLVPAAIVYVLPILGWIAFSWFAFGTALPKTLGAKLAQTESGLHGEGWIFLPHALHNLQLFFSIRMPSTPKWIGLWAWLILLVAPGLLGSVVAAWRRSPLLPLILAGYIQTLASIVLNLPNYLWYYLPLNLALGLSLAALVAALWQSGFAALPRRVVAAVLAGGFLFATVPDPRVITRASHPGYDHYRSDSAYPQYVELADWLRDNAASGSSIACAEIGVLGFRLPAFRIIDMWGLVTEGGIEAISRGDFTWWFDDRPDYVLMHDAPWTGPEKSVASLPEFLQEYELVRRKPDQLLFKRKKK